MDRKRFVSGRQTNRYKRGPQEEAHKEREKRRKRWKRAKFGHNYFRVI